MRVPRTVRKPSTLTSESPVITVALISNQHLVQLGVEQAVEAVTHISLVGHAKSGATAGVLLARTKPHVVLLDTESSFDMMDLVRLVRNIVPDSKIVALCGVGADYPKTGPIPSQVDAIVLTVQPTVVLIATIASLCQTFQRQARFSDDGPRDVSMSQAVASRGTGVPFEAKWPDALTERERDVVVQVGQGLTNKAIGVVLSISAITVRHHLTNIFDKLGVSGRQKLLIHAHRCGFVELQSPAATRSILHLFPP